MAELSGGATLSPLSGALGAEVTGLDVTAMDDRTFAEIHSAFLRHEVLVFRDQQIGPDAYVALARRFGDLADYPFAKGLEERPEITVIVKEADQTSNFGGMWHTDTTYTPAPPKATMLYAVETPAAGGDTLFACQHRAAETLSDGLRSALAGLSGVNSSTLNASALRTTHIATGTMKAASGPAALQAEHPVLRKHPETGRMSLYVNPSHTERFAGWTTEESRPLLDHLFTHQIQPEITCRVTWAPGTLVIWDNRACLHRAINDYDGHRREMWRITLQGDPPIRA